MTTQQEFEQAVLSYKYSSPNLSLFEQLFLDNFWNKFVYLYPTWLAPNLISLTGFLCIMAMYFLNWYSSPLGKGTAKPQYLYCLCAFLLFSYQTLDGSDGKQARRTQSGSALGELMDHGIDAIATGFAAAVVADALQFDLDKRVFWICVFGGQMTFFMSNLTLLHRGKQMFFPIDIMELQWVMIISMMISGVFGTRFWIDYHLPVPAVVSPYTDFLSKMAFEMHEEIPEGYIQPRFIVAFGAVFGTILNFFMYLSMAAAPYLGLYPPPPREAPGRGFFSLFKQTTKIIIYGSLCFYARYYISLVPDDATRLSCLRALLFGSCFAFGDLMDRLLVMRVAHIRLRWISPTIVCMTLFAVGFRTKFVAFPWYWGLAITCFIFHQGFGIWISQKLAAVLGISVFTIKKKQ